MSKVVIRKGTKEDVYSLLSLVKELAAYEKAADEVEITSDQLLEDGFGTNSIYEFYVAELGEEVVGIALYYHKYSTWKGRCIYLEDIVVNQSQRRLGIGRLLFEAVRKEAVLIKAKRMEWQVLDWNEPAIEFYKSLDAHFDHEWINVKLTGQQLDA